MLSPAGRGSINKKEKGERIRKIFLINTTYSVQIVSFSYHFVSKTDHFISFILKLRTPFLSANPSKMVFCPVGLHDLLIFLTPPFTPTSEPAKSKKKTLGAVVGSFKSSVTRRVRISGFIRGEAIWQRGYYEHVVRNIVDLEDIREYIANNPARWSLNND